MNKLERRLLCPTRFLSEHGSVFEFCLSVVNNPTVNNDPELIYFLAINNSIINNTLDPLIFIREFCYKIPNSAISYAKELRNQIISDYLLQNKWLTSLSGL